MSERKIVAQELGKLFSVLSNPDRIRIIEELRREELDVQSLSELLEISPSRVSQHLGQLRAMRLVEDVRDGKRHIYHLVKEDVAAWILDGLHFTEIGLVDTSNFNKAVRKARKIWETRED